MNARVKTSPSGAKRAALLELLQDEKRIDAAALARAELVAGRTGQPVEQVLNQLGSLSDEDLAEGCARVARCGVWDPLNQPISLDPATLGVSIEYLRRARLAPLHEERGWTVICACDPLDDEALSGLVFATGRKIRLLAARPGDWRRAFDRAFPEDGAQPLADERRLEREVDQVADGASEGQGARLVASAFEAAIAAKASDIHFEPRRHDFRIRLRVDGQLVDYRIVAAELAAPAVSRIKVIANLNLGERRLPQDGRTTFVVGGRPVDVRVATSPTVFGETAVLRILDRSAVALDLSALGLEPGVHESLMRAARAPHGLFLVTGPTGSGKTTTLYALLSTFIGSPRKVMSVEDPVEYHFEHVSQTQVQPNIGLTFASALRSFLRQDPDVILVGEIRDPETAAVAVQAAMTGHLVLASVHANDALAVISRLQDLGVEAYQLAAAFRGAAAQRLVRRLCTECRAEVPPDDVDRAFAQRRGLSLPSTLYRAEGCPACHGSGFKGRIPIAEAYLADESLLRSIAEEKPRADLAAGARELGLTSMAADGLLKAGRGLTTLAEVAAAVDA